jgi:hypothetical protein
MATPRTPKWINLSKARERLCNAFGPYFELFVDELLANAISSEHVPIRGVPSLLKSRPVAIDVGLIREADHVCILENKLHLRRKNGAAHFFEPADFVWAQIDWRKLEAFVHAHRVKIRKPSDHKVSAALARSVARHQQSQTRPSCSEHIRELQQELPRMTKHQYERARQQAIGSGILPPEWAKSGRKRNNRRVRQGESQRKLPQKALRRDP